MNRANKILQALLLLVLSVAGNSYAQSTNETITRVSKALSASEVTSLKYVGNAAVESSGQAARAEMHAPLAMRLVDLSVSLNFTSSTISLDYERVFSDWLYPNFKPARVTQHGAPNAAWTANTKSNIVTPNDVDERQLQLWMSPFGIVQLAREAGARANVMTDKKSGKRTLSFPYKNTMVKATLLDNDLLDRVEYATDSPLLGDMRNEVVFGNYRHFDGVRYPTHIVHNQNGFATLDTWINGVTINSESKLEVPQDVVDKFAASTNPAAPVVTVEQLAPGVFFIAGQSHNSTAIEFKDHIVIFDVPQDDARTLAVFAAAKKAIPNKPIGFAIVSHNHSDHAGGLRAAVAEGVTIITHSSNKMFFDNALAMQHKLKPDHLSKHPKKAKFRYIDDTLVLSDETRRVEIHRLEGFRHSDDMLVAYLPNEKILCEVDAFSYYPPPPGNAPVAPRVPDANALSLYENMLRLNMQVEQIAPGHGRAAQLKDFLSAVGKAEKM